MASITASVDAVRGIVFIEIDYASDPAVTSARIIRVETLTGDETNVRIHSWLSDEGLDCITLVGNSASTYDTEAPLDIPVYYRLEDCAGLAASVDSAEVVVPSSSRLWLKDPVRPYNNVPITMKGDPNPCVPVSGVYFRSMSEETFPGAGALQRAVNRRNAIAVVRTRYGYSSTLNLATRQFSDRDAVREILSTGDVLMIQSPAAYGIPEVYVHVTAGPAWQRLSSDHKKQWRLVAIPFDEVDRPAGLGFGVMGTRWMDMCDVFDTFADMEAAGISWRDVMVGLAGDMGDAIVSSWRTYAEVEAEFATYSAISAWATQVLDDFGRVTANGWGTASGAGGLWSVNGGALADYLTNGTVANHVHTAVNVPHHSFIGTVGLADVDIHINRIFTGILPATSPLQAGLLARWQDSNNHYSARLFLMTSNAVVVNIRMVVGGSETTTSNVTVPGVNATTTNIAMRFRVIGSNLKVRVWDNATTEPTTWLLETTHTSFASGAVGVRSSLQSGNTNALPFTFIFDDFTARTVDRTYQELLEGD